MYEYVIVSIRRKARIDKKRSLLRYKIELSGLGSAIIYTHVKGQKVIVCREARNVSCLVN